MLIGAISLLRWDGGAVCSLISFLGCILINDMLVGTISVAASYDMLVGAWLHCDIHVRVM